jgi:hypothetical protein
VFKVPLQIEQSRHFNAPGSLVHRFVRSRRNASSDNISSASPFRLDLIGVLRRCAGSVPDSRSAWR